EVQAGVEAAFGVGTQSERAQEVGTVLGLDADHGCAVVGEVAGGHRSRGAAAELDHAKASEDPAHITPSRASAASSAVPRPSSPKTSALCSPIRGARRR